MDPLKKGKVLDSMSEPDRQKLQQLLLPRPGFTEFQKLQIPVLKNRFHCLRK